MSESANINPESFEASVGLDAWDDDAARYESLHSGGTHSGDKPAAQGKSKSSAQAKTRGMPISQDGVNACGITASVPMDIETLTRQINLEDDEDGPPIPMGNKTDALPVSLLRSALFTVCRKDKSRPIHVQRCEIASQTGTRVVYEGPLLNQHDKLVWATALRLAKQSGKSANALFVFTKRQFLEAMGWSYSGASADWVWESLSRLSRASVSISRPKDTQGPFATSVCGTMLGNVLDNSRTQHFAFRFNPELLPQLASNDIHADIHFLRRSMLKNQLSQWLHDFYSTHSGDSSLPISSIRALCGIGENYTEAEFRKKLKAAISEIASLPGEDEFGQKIPSLFSHAMVEKNQATGIWRLSIKLAANSTTVHHPTRTREIEKPKRRARTTKKGAVAL